MPTELDERLMRLALEKAAECAAWGDVPIGAVVTRADQVLAAAGNARERLGDPTAHAEILALRQAARLVGSWRLEGCAMYVTLEPCAMCAGASVLARLDRIVFGAHDPKAGFAGSLGNIPRDPRLNHSVELEGGVLAEECSEILTSFFRARR
jgi:tRNA(adenine34) deaminase